MDKETRQQMIWGAFGPLMWKDRRFARIVSLTSGGTIGFLLLFLLLALAPSSNTILVEIVSWLAKVGIGIFALLGLVAVVFNVTTYFRQKQAAKQDQ